jgi:alpha-tubulin suppressor-like RCC1 family protein
MLALALAGCGGGGHAAPDGGDGHIDIDGGGDADATEGGGTSNGIVVDTPSGTVATGTQDGHCDILEAAVSATLRQGVGDCANPKGVARIVLQPDTTYPVPKTLRLTGAIVIGLGDGVSGRATIAAAPGFVVDPSDPSSSCLLSVTDGLPGVSVSDVTLTQDPGLALSGACVTNGELDLRRTRVTGFKAGGVVASCLPASGCDHNADGSMATALRVLGSLIDGNHNAQNGGGVVLAGPGASLFVAHTAIVGNTSDGDGGGLYLGGGWATNVLQDCTVSGNTAGGVGGGMVARFVDGTQTYVNVLTSTIASNTATGSGGGIQFDPPSVGSHDVAVFASIVAGNDSSSTLEWNINASWNTAHGVFNCVNGSFIYVAPGNPRPTDMGGCRFDVRNPFLGPLMPLGGAGDLPLHPLLVGSPAVDSSVGDSTRDDQRDDWIDGYDQTMPDTWMVFDPLVDGDGDGTAVRDLGAYERNDRWQTELLAVRAQGPASHAVVTIPGGFDRGAGTIYTAASATNEFVTYALPIGEPGRYDVTVRARTDTDAGKFQVAVADDPAGPWTALGAEQDGYSTPLGFASFGPFSALLATAGEKLVRFSVTGKNPASSGYRLYLDYIQVDKSKAACPVTDVAAGGGHTCAVMSGRSLRCWGADDAGQLGDGGGASRPSPPAIDLLMDVAAVAAGGSHTCVLSSGGGVRCWGGNGNGQLGDGSTATRATPPAAPVLTGAAAIAAGRTHTCALMMTGGVRCWGGNGNGQLGDGTTTDRSTPPGADVLTGVAAIAAGSQHTCALMTTGGVRCWGGNGNGQLGDGTTTDRSTPPPSDAGADLAAVSAGDSHTCALTTAGGVRCWGHNLYGELGIGSYDAVLAPPATDVLTGVAQIIAANMFTCALTTGGGVRCWGYNSHGEIGDDTSLAVDRWTPQTADILGGVASLAAGSAHVCARMASGGVRCWGDNETGQLGDGMRPILALTPPTLDMPGFTGTCP